MEINGVALVTGAGRGLGTAIARTLAAHGWQVAVNDLRAESAERVAADVGGFAVPGDVTDEAAVAGIVETATDRLGLIGCLVANATGPQPVVGFEDLTWRTHLDQLEFFVKSPTLLAQAVLPGMKTLGAGRIVNIGSDMPDRALPGWAAYSAAKAPSSPSPRSGRASSAPSTSPSTWSHLVGSRSSGTRTPRRPSGPPTPPKYRSVGWGHPPRWPTPLPFWPPAGQVSSLGSAYS
jgi:NADP-dependent 3-hydroxy acid dehydrogenase YdfG